MAMLQENNIKHILKIELWMFLTFIIIAFAFYQYKDSHIYYYKEDFFSNYNGGIALLGKITYLSLFCIEICFPFLWVIQLIILIRKKWFKKNWKFFLLTSILYLFSWFSWFSLYSINQHQSFLERRENTENKYREQKSNVPAYHFNEIIEFKGYDSTAIKSAVVELRKKQKTVSGKIDYLDRDILHLARIKFESIYDTIEENDSIVIIINNKENYITKIKQRYVKVANDNNKPAFIEYVLNGVKNKGNINGIISK